MVLILLLKKNGDVDNIEIKPTKKTIEGFIDENKMINYIKNKCENKGKPSSLGIHKRLKFQDSELCYIGFKQGKDNNKHDIDFFEDIIVIRNSLQTENCFENITDLKLDDYNIFMNCEEYKNDNLEGHDEGDGDDENDEDDENDGDDEDDEDDEEEINVGEEELELQDKEIYSEFSLGSEIIEIDIEKNTIDDEEEEEEELQDDEENLDEEILDFDSIDDTSELNIEEYNYPEEILKIINEEENNCDLHTIKEYDISKLNIYDINHI